MSQSYIALIANSIFPYGYEAVRVLSIPYNTQFRARFDENFVAEDIRNEFRNLRGMDGFYCFRDYSTGILIPLRAIRISDVTLVGNVYYIEYRAGELFDFPYVLRKFAEQIDDFNRRFFIEMDGTLKEQGPGRDLRPLVLRTSILPSFRSENDTVKDEYDVQTRRWVAAARYLGTYEYFRYIPFIKPIGLRRISDNYFQPLDDDLRINADEDYWLQVVHNLTSDSPTPHSINEGRTDRETKFIKRASFRLELRGDPSLIDIQEPQIFVTGSYDVNHFYFRTLSNLSSRRSTTLTIDYVAKPDPIGNLDTRLSIPAKVEPNLKFPLPRAVFLFALIAIYIVPNIYPLIFQYLQFNERIVQDATVIAISVTLFDLIREVRRYLSH